MLHAADAMRTVPHPGPPLPMRARFVIVRAATPARIVVPAGQDLFDAVHVALDRIDADGGSFTLVSGTVARLRLMTGGAGMDGFPMGFHGPHALRAPLTVVAGAAGSGLDEDRARFSHCHAAFRDADGRLVGGHLIPGETIAGTGGIAIDLIAIAGGRFERRHDPETRFTIFHPAAA